MDMLKSLLLTLFAFLLLNEVAGTNYAYNSYDGFRPLRRPTNQISHVPYAFDSFPPLRRPQPARRPGPNFFDVLPQNDPLWAQFWDVYNYRGPLEEDPSTVHESSFFLNGNHYQTPNNFFQQRIPQVPSSVGTTRDDAYNKYKEYFGRRFGSRFDD